MGEDCAEMANDDDLVAKEWDISSSFCDCSKRFINGWGRFWLIKS